MNRELFKQCDCAPGKWAKCDHPFHFRKMVNGRRWTISLDAWLGHDKIRSVGAAEPIAADIIAALKAGTFSPTGPTRGLGGAVMPPVTTHGHTFASVAATYLKGVEEDPEQKPAYRANLKSTINVITGWPIPDRAPLTLGDLPIGGVDNALLERYYKARVSAGRTVSSRNAHLQFLRAFSRWAMHAGYVSTSWLAPKDPGVTVKRRKGARRHRRLALPVVDDTGRLLVAGEYERLLAVADGRLRDLCVATYESGVRLAELHDVQWRHVDLPRREWTIYDSKDPDQVKFRVLPLSPVLVAVLERRRWGPDDKRLPPAAYVFGNEVGEPGGRITTAWENAVLKAHGFSNARDPETHGLTADARKAYQAIDLVFHDIRHEAASQWLEGGVRLEEISYLLGHESYETTRIYLNARPENLAARMATFHAAREASAGQSGVPVAYDAKSHPAKTLKMVPGKRRKRQVGQALA